MSPNRLVRQSNCANVTVYMRHSNYFFRVLALLLLATFALGCKQNEVAPPLPTRTSEPIIPTITPSAPEAIVLPTASPDPTAIPEPLVVATAMVVSSAETTEPTIIPSATPEQTAIINTTEFARFGVSGRAQLSKGAQAAGIPFTSFLDWHFKNTDLLPEGVDYWRMLNVREGEVKTPWDLLEPIIAAHPGDVWIIGNEPDVKWQQDSTPEDYATAYHEGYTKIKALDPTAQIAVAGIAQGTPLRLAYLDRVLAHYQATYGEPMPVDIWTLHAFTLREERDSWGVDIPSGMDEDTGELYEIEDHDDLTYFEGNIVNFRRWMMENGYQDKPLTITEFGILLPNDYGFPPEAVSQFMIDTLDILMTLKGDLGLASDENRLVQNWFWFILEEPPDRYPSGNLYNSADRSRTPLGDTWHNYLTQPRQNLP